MCIVVMMCSVKEDHTQITCAIQVKGEICFY
jgi:hypothetical protein